MRLLWKYLNPQRKYILIALLCAALNQVLSMIDPILFGKIIDNYANPEIKLPENQLVRGVLAWLGLAIGVALLARVAKAFQDYYTGYSVQRLGLQVFDEGLKQILEPSVNVIFFF